MTVPASDHGERSIFREVVHQLREAIAAPKCWCCGCLHGALSGLDEAASRGSAPELSEVRQVLQEAREKLVPSGYDCLGCPVCYPAIAVNRFAEAFPDLATSLDPCLMDLPEERSGWPPLPGQYRVVRYAAPVAVCTLTSDRLVESLLRAAAPAVGHLPGQSLLSLVRQGIDGRGRIVGAKGKRPILKGSWPCARTPLHPACSPDSGPPIGTPEAGPGGVLRDLPCGEELHDRG